MTNPHHITEPADAAAIRDDVRCAASGSSRAAPVIAGELSAYLDCWRRLERLLPPVGAGRTRVLQAIGAIPRDADQLAALSQIPASPKAKRRPYRPSLAQVEKTTGKKVSGIERSTEDRASGRVR